MRGGCCKICGSKQHLARDCDGNNNEGNGRNEHRGQKKLASAPPNKKIVFGSGDDLGDDFTLDETITEEEQTNTPETKKDVAKPKVVFF